MTVYYSDLTVHCKKVDGPQAICYILNIAAEKGGSRG